MAKKSNEKKPKHKEIEFEITFFGLKLKFKFIIKW